MSMMESCQVRYVPDWFPGANFKRLGKLWRLKVEKLRDMPYEATKKAIVSF